MIWKEYETYRMEMYGIDEYRIFEKPTTVEFY